MGKKKKSKLVAKKFDGSKVMTPMFRVSFPSVFTPNQFKNQDPKYSVTMLFDKDEDISALKKAAKRAMKEKFGNKKLKKAYNPFRDGNEKDLDGFEDCIFVKASSSSRPGLVDRNLQDIIDQEEFYAGCYARATIVAFAFDTDGNKGCSFSLDNIQKLKEGEPFSSKSKAEDDFGDDDDDNDDDDDDDDDNDDDYDDDNDDD